MVSEQKEDIIRDEVMIIYEIVVIILLGIIVFGLFIFRTNNKTEVVRDMGSFEVIEINGEEYIRSKDIYNAGNAYPLKGDKNEQKKEETKYQHNFEAEGDQFAASGSVSDNLAGGSSEGEKEGKIKLGLAIMSWIGLWGIFTGVAFAVIGVKDREAEIARIDANIKMEKENKKAADDFPD